jgi:hypothetical protein
MRVALTTLMPEDHAVMGDDSVRLCTQRTQRLHKELSFHALEVPDVDAYFFCVMEDGVSFGLGYLLRFEH